MYVTAAARLRLLGDDTRLRLLRLLAREPLNVSELTAVLGVAQSGVSRHLALLREAGLVTERKAAGFTWFRLSAEAADGASADAPLWAWLRGQFEVASVASRADDARLEEVRRLRQESFRQHGGADDRRQLVPGRSWAAWSRALGLLLPPLDVVDLGCGEGYLTIEAARWARRVTAVDQSPDVLARAKALARRRRVANIIWKRGRLERVPLRDASFDVALLSQALHHADDPARALTEARRVLKPGGRLVVLDLRTHDEAWVRSTLGDRWQGFEDDALRRLIEEAGFADVTVRVGARQVGDPFVVLVAAGTARDEARVFSIERKRR